MSEKELLEQYISVHSDYGKTLMWMYTNVGEGLFSLLEKAEFQGMKLDIRIIDEPYLVDEISADDIVFV